MPIVFLQTFLAGTGVNINLLPHKSEISSITDFGRAVEGFLNLVLFLGAFLTFGYMLWGGLDWIMSAGDSGKVEAARKKITHAVIGLAVLSCVFLFFMIVEYVLGLSVFSSPAPGGGGGSIPTPFPSPFTPF